MALHSSNLASLPHINTCTQAATNFSRSASFFVWHGSSRFPILLPVTNSPKACEFVFTGAGEWRPLDHLGV